MQQVIGLYKEIGETPLECLEAFKEENPEYTDVPMTYVGRLDPMAEGMLLVLAGVAISKKETYMGMDKEYEFEVLFGFSTDTYDLLGKIPQTTDSPLPEDILERASEKILSLQGVHTQPYPPYSSKTVNGKPLFEYAREGRMDEITLPTKEITVKEIEVLDASYENARDLEKRTEVIMHVFGDFRQKEIYEQWKEVFSGSDKKYPVLKARAIVSSGTYIRSLAHMVGEMTGVPALALSIKRTRYIERER